MTVPEPGQWPLPDPRMASVSWLRDGVHGPRPLPPLAGDVIERWFSLVMGRPVIVVNGFFFMSMGPGGSSAGFQVAPQADPAEAWFDFYVPRVEAVARWAAERDWDALSLEEAVAALPEIFDGLAGAFASTMAPLEGLGGPLNDLIAFCQRYFGEGEIEASTLLQGHANATSEIGAGLAELAEAARGDAALTAAINARTLPPVGTPWRSAFDAVVDRYGRGNQTWFEFHHPSWREDPAVPLGMVARLLEAAPDASGGEPDKAAERRDAAISLAKERLPGDSERGALDELLERNRAYVAVIEDRARLQLVLAACPRPAALAIGRKLAAAGVIENPDDVFFLRLGELRAPQPSLATAVEARRAAWASWHELEPPDSIGAPLPPGIGRVAQLRQQFGVGAPAETDDGIVRGFGAAPGTVTGTARIVRSLDEGDRLEPGEILVCYNTAPPWTPLLAIASALVTESGGVLSHAAIAAREYGIPAVVGARNVTRRIPDGATVTVDGGSGTVTVEPSPTAI